MPHAYPHCLKLNCNQNFPYSLPSKIIIIKYQVEVESADVI